MSLRLVLSDHQEDEFVLWLRWTCQCCGWSVVIDAPGFAGDGENHFPDGRTPCGPVTAQKVVVPAPVFSSPPQEPKE